MIHSFICVGAPIGLFSHSLFRLEARLNGTPPEHTAVEIVVFAVLIPALSAALLMYHKRLDELRKKNFEEYVLNCDIDTLQFWLTYGTRKRWVVVVQFINLGFFLAIIICSLFCLLFIPSTIILRAWVESVLVSGFFLGLAFANIGVGIWAECRSWCDELERKKIIERQESA